MDGLLGLANLNSTMRRRRSRTSPNACGPRPPNLAHSASRPADLSRWRSGSVSAAAACERGDARERRERNRSAEHDGQSLMEGTRYEIREELTAGDHVLIFGGQVRQHTARRKQVLQRVDAQHRCEQRRDRRQCGDLLRDGVGHTLILQSTCERVGQAVSEADNHQREEDADRQRRAAVLECRAHP